MRFAPMAMLLALSVCLPACGQVADAKRFVARAGAYTQFEIEASKLALSKAANQDVKAFAQQTASYHEAASEKLGRAALASGGLPPPAGLDAVQTRRLRDLRQAEGAEFDRLFVEQQLEAYQNAVVIYANYSKLGAGGPIKAFAAEEVAALEAHLSHIRGLKATPLTSFLEVPVSSWGADRSSRV